MRFAAGLEVLKTAKWLRRAVTAARCARSGGEARDALMQQPA